MTQQQGTVSFLRYCPITHERPQVDANGAPLSDNGNARTDAKHLLGSEKDSSLQERLTIAPDLEVYLLNKHSSVLIFSKIRKVVLKGGIWLDLLPLLTQGELNGTQIEQQLATKHNSLAVRTALYHLLSRGAMVSNEHSLTAMQALSWATQGLTPSEAEQRLHDMPLHTTTLADKPFPAALLSKLQELGGWQHVDSPADARLIIYRVDSYQQEEIAAINARHLADGKKWMLLQLRADTVLCGPLFCSAPHPVINNRPCWQCLNVAMLESDDSIVGFLQNNTHQLLPRPTPHPDMHAEGLAMRLHAELGTLLLDDEVEAPLRAHLMMFSLPQMRGEYHWVMQRPQCRACGYGKLDASRAPQPLHLQRQTAVDFTSGGIRTRTAERAFEQWCKHVSPITGATNNLYCTRGSYHSADGATWDWFHNSLGGKNRALPDKPLANLIKNFRAISGGKGSTAVQSHVSAICESFERSAGVFRNEDERYRRARFRDFKEGEAIDPNTVALYSAQQFRHRESINAMGSRYYVVPEMLDHEDEVRWTPVWSLSEERHKYLITSSLYYPGIDHEEIDKKYRYACSNGCSGGATLEEAVLQGFYELIERDACAIWWYNRLQLPAVDLDKFDDPWLRRAKTFYAAVQRDLWVLDMTSDLGVPACVALSRRTTCSDTYDRTIFGLGTHLNQRIAVYRAISEMNQSLEGLDLGCPEGVDYAEWVKERNPKEALHWLTEVSAQDEAFSWILPAPDMPAITYANHEYGDNLEEINHLRAIVESKGMEVLVLDQSRAEIDYRVARVVVPGLRHFWCRLAAGRLYDVPVVRGQLSQAHREEDMNPIAMFI